MFLIRLLSRFADHREDKLRIGLARVNLNLMILMAHMRIACLMINRNKLNDAFNRVDFITCSLLRGIKFLYIHLYIYIYIPSAPDNFIILYIIIHYTLFNCTFSYTGHCPTLKFRVGKRFGACTQEIMKVRACK